MLKKKRIVVVGALLFGVALSGLLGCNFLQYQFCISNLTSYNLNEVNIVPEGSSSWGANLLDGLLQPGKSQDIGGFQSGFWMVRAVFDVVDASGFCTPVINDLYIVTNTGLHITTTNICIDYAERAGVDVKANVCTSLYGTARFEI